jgi:hypothetical protein
MKYLNLSEPTEILTFRSRHQSRFTEAERPVNVRAVVQDFYYRDKATLKEPTKREYGE